MDPVHLSDMAGRLVRAIQQPGQAEGRAATASLRESLRLLSVASARASAGAMRPRQSSTLVWALGRIADSMRPAPQSHPTTTALDEDVWGEQPTELVAALSEAEAASRRLLQRVCEMLTMASSRDVAQALYGAALISRAAARPAPVPAALLEALRRLLPACGPQDLSMSTYALALLEAGPLPPALLADLLEATRLAMPRCSCQALANVAWGLAAMERQRRERRRRGDNHAEDEGVEESVSPSLLWLRAFCDSSLSCMAMFNDHELSIVIWALAEMRLRPGPEWMSRLEV